MKLFIVGLVLSCSFSALFAEETRLIELEPDHAAQIINQQDQSLRYAPKIESNVPGVRFIGDHPEHVVEDIYLANQYHGQDGLGAYVYGYSIPDISKTEKKERSGDLKGAYNYISGDGQEIKVEYWDDGTGFHQIDNVPKIQPKQVEDSPDVQAAKEAHLKRWQEEAERNSHPIADPYADSQYNQPQQPQQPLQSQYQQYQGQVSLQPQPYASQNQGSYQQQAAGVGQQYGATGQHRGMYQNTGATGQYSPNSVEYSGQYSANQQTWSKGPGAAEHAGEEAGSNVAASSSHQQQQARIQGPGKQIQQDEEEVTGPPKGFFYAFDYPVGIIVGREGKNLEAYYSQNKQLFEKQLSGQAPRPSSSASGYHASA